MSQEIDERVVEMRFDNAQFEKNTRQSIRTLNELNESLKLDGAEEGFEKIDKAAAKVDFDKMESSLETLNSKFSALEVMGVTALMRITNQAMDAGQKLVNSLSIDQVTAGWNKYAQKTASVQTIMNATGKSITKVNSYLDKLMWFSDETSYGFTDMTAALSTLTSAGGDIEKMIPMIIGMANATAYAGKGAAEFQRVIYNLAQSYGTGAIQLIDWKSVEQAGVASQQLKQLLIDTGVELGKIKEGAVTTGSFDNSLQKKWADQEVMETAFGKYAEFAEAVKAELDANPNKYHNQASLAIEAIADQYDEVTVKAFKAAQEAKSFSEAVDATKDAVSSGWMETFDILFGNYEEAKGFWSDLAEEFWTMFAGGQNSRNNWLKSAFDSGLDQLLGTDGFGDATDSYTNLLRKALVNQGLLTEEAIEDAGSFQKALEESGVTAEQLYDVIGGAAEHYAKRAAMSDKELDKLDLDRDKVDKLAEAYGSMAEKIQNGSVNLDDFAGKMNQLSGREHFFNGILNILEGINSLLDPMRDAFSDVFMVDGSPLYNFLKEFDELTSKMRLSEGTAKKIQKVFKGFFSVLNTGFKALKITGQVVFSIFEQLANVLSPVGDLLLGIGSRIGDVLTWVDQSMSEAESLTDVLAILAGAVWALVSPIVELGQGFMSLLRGGSIEEAKQQFGGFATVVNAVSGVLDNFKLGGIGKAVTSLSGTLNDFKIGTVSVSSIIGNAVTALGGVLMLAFDGVGALIASAFSGFENAGRTVEDFKKNHVPMLEVIKNAVLSLPQAAMDMLSDFGGTLSGIMSNIGSACETALEAVKNFFDLDGVDIYRLLALIDVGALALAIYGATKLLKKASDTLKNTFANPVADFLEAMTGAVKSWTAAHTTNNLATAAKGIATAVAMISASMYLLSKIEDPMQAAQALGSVMAAMFGLVAAMKVLAATDLTGLDTAKIFATMMAFSTGLLGMAASIKIIAGAMAAFKYFNQKQMNNVVGAVMAISFVLAGMVTVIGLINKFQGSTKGISSFLVVAASLVEVCGALYLIGGLDENTLMSAYGAIFTLGLTMSGMVAVVGAINKFKGNTKGISSFLVVAASLIVVAQAVSMFGAIENLDNTMLAVLGTLVTMAGAIAIMSKFGGKAKKMLAGANAMVIASASLLVMAGAIAAFSAVMSSDDGAGFAGVSLALIELAGAIYLLGKNAIESTAAAAAMVAMGAALIEMAWAIKMLADVPFETLCVNLGLLGVGLLVLVGICAILPAAAPGLLAIAGACLTLSTALLMLAPACYLLSGLSLNQALAGFTGMLAILVGLGIIGSSPPIALGLEALSVSLIAAAKAFSIFAGGLIKLSIAAGILTILAAFAGPLKEAIVGAAGDIEAALTAIVTAICNTINNCAEPIGEALETLLKVVIQVVIDMIGWAWDGNGEGGGIKAALDDLWEKLMGWISDHFSIDDPFDISSWIDTFTADDRPIGMLMNKIFGDDISEAGKGLIEQLKGTGEDMGTNLNKGFVKGTEENADEPADAAGDVAQTTLDRMQTELDEHSPSRKTYEFGEYMALGLANGLIAPESLTAVTTAATELSNAAETTIRDYWGIHSPSWLMKIFGIFLGEGWGEGISSEESKQAASAGVTDFSNSAETDVTNSLQGAVNAAETQGENAATGFWGKFQSGFNSFLNKFKSSDTGKAIQQAVGDVGSFLSSDLNIVGSKNTNLNGSNNKNQNGKSGLTDEDYDEDAKKDPTTTKPSSTTSSTKKKSGSSTKKKTVAEQIEEKYKTKLEANKVLRDTTDETYELWLSQNQKSASMDAVLKNESAHAANVIAIQTDRVALAEQKYNELYNKWGKDKAETKEAYLDLIQERQALEELKTSTSEDFVSRIEEKQKPILEANQVLRDTTDETYELWMTENENSADMDTLLKNKTEHAANVIAIQAGRVALAEQKYNAIAAELGADSDEAKQAYGKAADIQVQGISVENVYAYADKLLEGKGGVGIYPPGLGRSNGWVHVDVRKDKSRWKG